MKKMFFFLLFIMTFQYNVNCQSLNNPLEFQKNLYDIETITKDSIIKKSFKFKNVGKQNVLLTKLDKSCTCSKAYFYKNDTLISPGEEGKIIMEVDTKNKYGKFMVYVVLIANTEQKFYKLILKGNKQ